MIKALDGDNPQVWHWRYNEWHRVPWAQWMSFREINEPFVPLPDVTAGEHYFVVCAIEDGRLFNIIPHRYLIDRDGRIAKDGYFGVLSDEEIKHYEALNKRHYEYPQTNPLNRAEEETFAALRSRLWRSWLPPVEAARQLTRAVTALPDENDNAAWHMLEACGLTRGTSHRPS
jgi:hypothetical protein